MKNSNLKLNERYELHNNVKFNIFDDFVALFSLSDIHQTTFPYVINIYQRRAAPYFDHLFMLFHLAGVPSLPLPAFMNFCHGFLGQLQKSDQKMAENAK